MKPSSTVSFRKQIRYYLLKALRGLTPYEYICHQGENTRAIQIKPVPPHLGPNTTSTGALTFCLVGIIYPW